MLWSFLLMRPCAECQGDWKNRDVVLDLRDRVTRNRGEGCLGQVGVDAVLLDTARGRDGLGDGTGGCPRRRRALRNHGAGEQGEEEGRGEHDERACMYVVLIKKKKGAGSGCRSSKKQSKGDWRFARETRITPSEGREKRARRVRGESGWTARRGFYAMGLMGGLMERPKGTRCRNKVVVQSLTACAMGWE